MLAWLLYSMRRRLHQSDLQPAGENVLVQFVVAKVGVKHVLSSTAYVIYAEHACIVWRTLHGVRQQKLFELQKRRLHRSSRAVGRVVCVDDPFGNR